MTPKHILILAVMFLLVTGSLLPELSADHSSETNKEIKTNIAVGKGTSVKLFTDDYISVSSIYIYIS